MTLFLWLLCVVSWLAVVTNAWCTGTVRNQRKSTLEACPQKCRWSRRNILQGATLAVVGSTGSVSNAAGLDDKKRVYKQRFPTLFDPLYGEAIRETIKRPLGPNIFALEQNLALGPLETPLRCVVVRLDDGTLWVHAPLAPTEEFFELVESCAGASGNAAAVAHVVAPTYALEHKVFVKDALKRWPNARLWTSPGQFSFPFSVSEQLVFGKKVSGIFKDSDKYDTQVPWTHELEYETLAAGTFNIGYTPTTLYETVFFHKASKTLILTDSLARISKSIPPLNDPKKLLLISKRSTADPMPDDTPEARLIGWEKTSLLVSYFFPEHEEPDPNNLGVVTWTDGWQDNFDALANRLVVPPVVRTILYAQNPARVQRWVDRVVERWELEQIVPAHFDAPIQATRGDFEKAFRFLQDDTIDEFPVNDLARGLRPIADIALKKL